MEVLLSFVPPVVLLLAIYVFGIRPRRTQAAKHAAMIAGLRAEDVVTTSGGVRGRVVGWKGDLVVVEVAPGVQFDIDPAKIESVSAPEPPLRRARSPHPDECPDCGAPAGPGDQFCGDCGAPLS
jgi:preprotein translocase YajC subunit